VDGYVVVVFKSVLGNIPKSSKIVVPALEAYYLFNKDRRDFLVNYSKATGNIALLAIGAGEITAAYQGYTLTKTAYSVYIGIKALSDVGMGIADIVINEKLAKDTSPEGIERLKRWNRINAYYTVGSLSLTAVDAAILKFGKNIDDAQSFGNICSELEEKLAKTGGKLADNLTGALKSIYDDLLTKGFNAVEEAGKIKFLDNTGRYLAEISNGKLIFKYAGFGGDVVITEGRTTTVLGKFTEPNNTTIGTRYFLGSNGTPVVQGFPNGSINRGVGSAIPNRLNFLDLPEPQYNALINNNIKMELEIALGSSTNINFASQSIPDVKNLIKASHPGLTTTQIDNLVLNGITKGNKEFWTNYNLPFLEQAFQRGDDIRLVSDPDFYKNATDVIGGTYKKELLAIDQLKGKYGYSYNSATKTYYKN